MSEDRTDMPPDGPARPRRIAWGVIVFQGALYAWLIGAVAVSVCLEFRGVP
ncbi:hypothetical protein [Niveispirillum fermenti]|uniref:hypothetical protein n=1 Tax=Niveispirillum fermenti TaxID=1233113 RepID=UPI003A8B63C6